MRQITSLCLLCALFLFFSLNSFTQVAINDNNSAPHASAMLDVNVFGVNKKGVLVPRMTTAQRIAIAAPATSLLVFDTNTNSFWYWGGASWLELISSNVNYWAANGNNIYNTNSGRIGLGTNTPSGFLHVAENRTVIFGLDSLSSTIGKKMVWFGNKGALRFAEIQLGGGDSWDYANIGVNSIAIGEGAKASGPQSFSQGYYSNATGYYSFARGFAASANGDHSMAFGQNLTANGIRAIAFGETTWLDGDWSFASGRDNVITGDYAATFGQGLRGRPFNSFVVGRYNDSVVGASPTTWVATDPLFIVGNGTANNARSNAFVITKEGRIGVGVTTPNAGLHIGTLAGASLQLGSIEQFEDAGSNLISTNSSLIPSTDNSRSLGNPTFRWTTIYAVNGTINTSDLRDKKNVTSLGYGLDAIMQLRPVSFDWDNGTVQVGKKLGLIAQDVLKIIPEVVKTHEFEVMDESSQQMQKKELNRFGIYYSDLVPVLIKSIQEQQELIIRQQQKMMELEKRLAALELRNQ